jgi:hypothetical protein
MFEQHELTHKPGARLQYCTRVRWDSVVFVHELRHTNQELDCSTVQGSDGTQEYVYMNAHTNQELDCSTAQGSDGTQ